MSTNIENAKRLVTRIILRNDSTTGWADEDSLLLKGEVGIEFLADGKVKMKIGDGEHTWSQLSYFGGDECKVTEYEVAKGASHTTELNKISSPNKGDIAIIKEKIIADSSIATGTDVTQKYQYTAYVYGETNSGSAWKAMDGNYSAENVYFDEDLTYTANIGVLDLGSKKSDKLEAAGKSLEQVMKSILAKTVHSEKTDPSYKIDTATATYEGLEVGSYITKLNWTSTFTDGKYSQGTVTDENGTGYTTNQSAGCTATAYDITATYTLPGEGGASTSVTKSGTGEDSSISLDNDRIQIDSTSEKTYATIAANCTYSGPSKLPATNLGEYDDECTQITSNDTLTATSKSIKLTGHRCMFYKYFSTDIPEASFEMPSGDEIRASWTKLKQVGNKIDGKDELTIPITQGTGKNHIVICLYGSKYITYAKESASNYMQDLVGSFMPKGTVYIKGANGFCADTTEETNGGASYNVFRYSGNSLSKNNYVIKIGDNPGGDN